MRFILVASMVIPAFFPGAAAAVTSQSCPGGRTAHAHDFGDQVGEDYNNLYEQFIAKSPPSKVSVASSWTCTNFQRVDGVDFLVFTAGLAANGSLGGSSLTARGCGQVFVTDLNTGSRFDVHDEDALDPRENAVTCSYSQHVATLTPGHSFLFEVSASLTYDWEAPSEDTSYPFMARLDVHSQVPQPFPNVHNHPVCYKAIPQVACNSVPV